MERIPDNKYYVGLSTSQKSNNFPGKKSSAESNSIRKSMMLGNKLVSALSLDSREIDISEIRDLIMDGAQIDRVDCKRCTPLHLAVWHGREDLVELLLTHGAGKYIDEVSDGDCSTPLLLACSLGYTSIVKILIKWGATISLVDERTGDTALHTAVDGGFLDIVIILLKAGAEPLAKNLQQQTSLDFARLNEYQEAWQIIHSICLKDLRSISRLNVLNVLIDNGSRDFIEKITSLPLPDIVKKYLECKPIC